MRMILTSLVGKSLVYMVYTEEDGSQHRGDSPTLFEKRVSSLKSLILG